MRRPRKLKRSSHYCVTLEYIVKLEDPETMDARDAGDYVLTYYVKKRPVRYRVKAINLHAEVEP